MSLKAYDTLLLSEPAPNVLQVGLNRPDVRNALNTRMGFSVRRMCERTADKVPDADR